MLALHALTVTYIFNPPFQELLTVNLAHVSYS